MHVNKSCPGDGEAVYLYEGGRESTEGRSSEGDPIRLPRHDCVAGGTPSPRNSMHLTFQLPPVVQTQYCEASEHTIMTMTGLQVGLGSCLIRNHSQCTRQL